MEKLKREMLEAQKQLKMIRDEVRLQAHLASLDLKDQWAKLEPKIHEAEEYVNDISEATVGAARDVLRRAKALRDQLQEARSGHNKVGH